jgi:chemotaxis protein MotA
MFAIIGIAVVIVAILGGYLMEHGPLLVLLQPAELLIILGASIGTILIANPLPVVLRLLKDILAVFKGDGRDKACYLENLKMLNELFGYARKNGLAKLETDVDEPAKSPVFTKYPKFLKEPSRRPIHLRYVAHVHQRRSGPVRTRSNDGAGHGSAPSRSPGTGERAQYSRRRAARSGHRGRRPRIVITMGALGGPPEEIGKKVGAALVGTFLGILLCYGFFGPIAARMARINESEAQYYHVMRVGVLAFIRGAAPILAVEFARRAIPSSMRPTFKELEATCRRGSTTVAAAQTVAA